MFQPTDLGVSNFLRSFALSSNIRDRRAQRKLERELLAARVDNEKYRRQAAEDKKATNDQITWNKQLRDSSANTSKYGFKRPARSGELRGERGTAFGFAADKGLSGEQQVAQARRAWRYKNPSKSLEMARLDRNGDIAAMASADLREWRDSRNNDAFNPDKFVDSMPSNPDTESDEIRDTLNARRSIAESEERRFKSGEMSNDSPYADMAFAGVDDAKSTPDRTRFVPNPAWDPNPDTRDWDQPRYIPEPSGDKIVFGDTLFGDGESDQESRREMVQDGTVYDAQVHDMEGTTFQVGDRGQQGSGQNQDRRQLDPDTLISMRIGEMTEEQADGLTAAVEAQLSPVQRRAFAVETAGSDPRERALAAYFFSESIQPQDTQQYGTPNLTAENKERFAAAKAGIGPRQSGAFSSQERRERSQTTDAIVGALVQAQRAASPQQAAGILGQVYDAMADSSLNFDRVKVNDVLDKMLARENQTTGTERQAFKLAMTNLQDRLRGLDDNFMSVLPGWRERQAEQIMNSASPTKGQGVVTRGRNVLRGRKPGKKPAPTRPKTPQNVRDAADLFGRRLRGEK